MADVTGKISSLPKDKRLNSEHFGRRGGGGGEGKLASMEKNFTPPCMSLLSIFSDCIKEGHQMHNVNECSLVLKTNNCFLALCTNFNSCWNW